MSRAVALLVSILLLGCAPAAAPPAPGLADLEAELRRMIAAATGDTAEVAVALRDLESGREVMIDADLEMHAASTMKVPVMVEVYRMADRGLLSLDDPVEVRTTFRSLADGSPYTVGARADLRERIGEEVPVRYLVEEMITVSDNLATNLLLELAPPERIARTLSELDAGGMHVLRGLQDLAAFERGMSNTTDARGYLAVLDAIARGRAASPEANREMLGVLERQRFRSMIPAALPEGVRVGNKTGSITRIQHDGAIVMPQGREPYVLVVLTRGFDDQEASRRVIREVSARVWTALAAATGR